MMIIVIFVILLGSCIYLMGRRALTVEEKENRKKEREAAKNLKRANESTINEVLEPNRKKGKNQIDSERMAQKRKNQTDEERSRSQAEDRERMAQIRQNQTNEERARLQAANRERMVQNRQNQTVEERSRSQAVNRERMIQSRQNQTDDERSRSQTANRERMVQNRQIQTVEERSRSQAVNRERMIQSRQNQSYEQSLKTKLNDRKRKSNVQRAAIPFKAFDKSNNIERHDSGLMNVICTCCGAKNFKGEKISNKGLSFSICCEHGKVNLEPMSYPEEIKKLFDLPEFLKKIRIYNNQHAFASFNANQVAFNASRTGPFSYIVQGQVYNTINTSLIPQNNKRAQYGQIYIVDDDTAIDTRTNSIYGDLDKNIVKIITKTLNEINVHAKAYKMFNEELLKEQTVDEPKELYLHFGIKPGQDIRRYNLRTSNEVAAVFETNADGEIPDAYVTIKPKGQMKLEQVSNLNQNVEPWVYPLLFPFGKYGYDIKLNVTRAAYTKYRLRDVDGVFNPIIRSGRLFCQWLVDSYLKIEKERIIYFYKNQEKIKAKNYASVNNALTKTAEKTGATIGNVNILPATFVGSSRYMEQNFQDAMTIVRKFGKPDLFITMTCNPSWPEIKENLYPGQNITDRPDIAARVFRQKVDHLIELITKQEIFGTVTAYVYTIEFQKRGLPHVHLLINLANKNKLRNADDIDKFISAELPDKDQHPELYDKVVRHMLHGPCGSRCQKNGTCGKKFPKDFIDETIVEEDGYPHYKRPNNGRCHEKNIGSSAYTFTNQHVIPYCPFLLLTMDCHINVEVVGSIKAVKYLYKYIFKKT